MLTNRTSFLSKGNSLRIKFVQAALLFLMFPVLEGKVLKENGHPIENATIYNLRSQKPCPLKCQKYIYLNKSRKGDTLQINFRGYEGQSVVV